jgi:hypothetical protein
MDGVEIISAKGTIMDSPLIPALLVLTMLATGFIPIFLSL